MKCETCFYSKKTKVFDPVIETRQHRVLTEYKVPGIKLKIYHGLVEMNYAPVEVEE